MCFKVSPSCKENYRIGSTEDFHSERTASRQNCLSECRGIPGEGVLPVECRVDCVFQAVIPYGITARKLYSRSAIPFLPLTIGLLYRPRIRLKIIYFSVEFHIHKSFHIFLAESTDYRRHSLDAVKRDTSLTDIIYFPSYKPAIIGMTSPVNKFS